MAHSTDGRQRGVLIAAILAVSMTMIDQTIVAICGPIVQEDLGISHSSVQWAINAYILATAATFALGGKLADHYGHRRMALVGIAAFGVTSVLCSAAPSGDLAAPWLISARVLQGISGGLMFPAALGAVIATFDRAKRGSAMATFFAITGAMTAIGPIAGGLLTQWTWRSIFWINVPIALVALLVLSRVPAGDDARTRVASRIDCRGAALIAMGMVLLIIGLQQSDRWPLAVALAVAVLGAVVLVVAVRTALRTPQPLADVRRFASRGFSASALAITLASFAFVPMLFFLSVYGLVSQGLSPESSGLAMFKFFIGFIIASRIGARIFDQRGAKLPIIIGGIAGAAGFVWWASTLTDLSVDGGNFVNPQLWPTLLAGVGIGFVMTPTSTDGVNRGDEASYGEITGIFQTLRNLGAAVGLAMMSALVDHRLSDRLVGSFGRLGAPADVARNVADQISGKAGADGGRGDLSAAQAQQFTHAVQLGYAQSVQTAYYVMAGAMVLVAIVGVVMHPGDRTSAELEVPPTTEQEQPGPVPA